MPYALCATKGGELVAGLSDGHILLSRDSGDSWEPAPVRAKAILALSVGEAR
jgi:hypothetical protein